MFEPFRIDEDTDGQGTMVFRRPLHFASPTTMTGVCINLDPGWCHAAQGGNAPSIDVQVFSDGGVATGARQNAAVCTACVPEVTSDFCDPGVIVPVRKAGGQPLVGTIFTVQFEITLPRYPDARHVTGEVYVYYQESGVAPARDYWRLLFARRNDLEGWLAD